MARFTNQAQLRYGNAVTNSNIAVGEILEVLSAKKTAMQPTYGQNDTITYLITLVNAGNTAFTDLTIKDDLGTYEFNTTTLTPLTYVADTIHYYINGTLQPAPTVTAGPPLTITGISIPANGNVTIVYEVTTNQFAPLAPESSINNTAVISGGGITPITVNESVLADSSPLLNITKSVSPVPVAENGQLTYTFLIQNSGSAPALAGSNAVITDTFDPVLSNISVTFNDTAWRETTNYTYDETTGLFATLAGEITVPAASYTQDPVTGAWLVNPGVSTLEITGTI